MDQRGVEPRQAASSTPCSPTELLVQPLHSRLFDAIREAVDVHNEEAIRPGDGASGLEVDRIADQVPVPERELHATVL